MSNNLNLDQVAPSQSSKEATINAATGELDAALTEFLVIDMTNNVTLSALNYQRYLKYKLTPTGTSKTLTLPAQKKFSIISNDGTLAVTIAVGTATVSLAANSNGFFYTDGSANGLAQQGGGAGGGSFTLTTTGTSGLASFTGGVLNIPHYQDLLTLTTTGTSGAATLAGGALNIPNYATGGGGGFEITDGTHDITGTTKLTVSGATVGGVTPNATLTITGGSGGSVTVSDTPPGSPTAGALWFDSLGGQLYIYYNDGNSSQWVPAANQSLASQPLGRNKIINGDMRVNQRGLTSGGFATIASSNYGFDRWTVVAAQAAKVSQSLYAGGLGGMPPGFTNSLVVSTPGTTYTAAAAEYFLLTQYIEGLNIQDLGWGAAGALPVTLSFWFLSAGTGTFSGALSNGGGTRSYPFSWSYPTASVWQKVTVTVPGDVTGTWTTDNSAGIAVIFDLGSGSTLRGPANAWAATSYYGVTGSVALIGRASTTFLVTGVQLEAGITATPFERRLYGDELSLCQRYFIDVAFGGSTTAYGVGCYSPVATTTTTAMLTLPAMMRITPAAAVRNQSYGNASGVNVTPASPATIATSLVTTVAGNNANAFFNAAFSAEL